MLKDTHGLTHLGATSLVMGLVEAGRIRLVAEGPEGSFVPGHPRTPGSTSRTR